MKELCATIHSGLGSLRYVCLQYRCFEIYLADCSTSSVEWRGEAEVLQRGFEPGSVGWNTRDGSHVKSLDQSAFFCV